MERREFTAEQLIVMPHEGCRHELVRGELRTASLAGWRHGAVAMRIGRLVGNHVEAHRLGTVFAAETGCVLERRPDTVRAADVAFVSSARMAAMDATTAFLPGAPDLAVEVLSPSDTGPEVREKVAVWLRSGCRMVWIVDPERRRAEVHRPDAQFLTVREDGVLDGGQVLPGLQLPLRTLLDG